jgi:tetratricopeptide (TPR) repeat protein
MKKKNITVLSLIATLIFLGLVINIFFKRPNIVEKINDLRNEIGPGLDSFNRKLHAENIFFDSIQHLIDSKKLDGADNIVTQLLNKNHLDDGLHVFKGEIYDARMQYDSALKEYDFVISRIQYSNALANRAALFIKLGKYQMGIEDYKKLYEVNYDYSYQLAQTFELLKQKDSAFKYYNIYLEHYPDSILQKKMNLKEK